ncbi:MAG: alpha/beta fold hydrolase [Anaerolineae bacterium]|nr:alpha/beta fold hydrolase [Anaerolineae bacterium]
MRAFKLLFVLVLIALLSSALLPTYAQGDKPKPIGLRPDAPPYALHGPFFIGMKAFATKTDSHPTTVQVWYPALNPKGVEEVAEVQTSVGRILMRAVQNDAPNPSGGPYPLIIAAHGIGSQRLYATYLSEHLASHGFVVLSIDYIDSSGSPFNIATSTYTRLKDVSWQIDYAGQLTAKGGELAGMIDMQRIAVIGHSYGAFTALQTAGAQMDFSTPTSWCVKYPDIGLGEGGSFLIKRDICDHAKEIADAAHLDKLPEGLWPSWADSRVDAVVPMAPSPMFGTEGTRAVTVPALIMVGSKDREVRSDLPLYPSFAYENVGSSQKSLVVFEGGDHLIFANSCATNLDWIPAGAFQYCSDPLWDMDRAHDLINHFTTAFLLDVIKGDKDAHKALLPDAVKFVGIQYKTTLK